MEKKLLGVVVVVCLCSAVALALDPLGPPAAGLKAGKFSAGLDYAYSQMDLKFDGKYSWYVDMGPGFSDTVSLDYKHKNAQMNKAYLNIGYGACDNVQVFGRLGGANLYGKRNGMMSYGPDTETWLDETTYDSDTGFAIGFGTKATLWENTKWKIGGIFQASWASVDYDTLFEGYDYIGGNSWYVRSGGQMDFWELQFALGATYEVSPRFTMFGGPFYYIFTGQYTHKGADSYGYDDDDYMSIKGDYDVDDIGCFGGFLGAQIAITDNVSWNAEYQLAKGAMALGTNLTWRF